MLLWQRFQLLFNHRRMRYFLQVIRDSILVENRLNDKIKAIKCEVFSDASTRAGIIFEYGHD